MTLSAAAVSMLLRLLEAPSLVVGAPALTHAPASAAELMECGLLVADGCLTTFEDQDGLHEVRFEAGRGQIGYSNPLEGWISLEREQLQLYRLELRACLILLLGEDLKVNSQNPIELDAGMIFEVGRLPLVSAAPTSIWFARRLFEHDALYRLNEAMERRPPEGLRIVLTSTAPELLPKCEVRGAKIVAMSDALAEGAAHIDTDILRRRLLGISAAAFSEPLWIADDGSELRANGEVISFNGPKQRTIMRLLNEHYRKGTRIKLEDLLHQAGSRSRDLESLFKPQWPRLSRYIDKEWGRYTLKLPA